jgi:hypothetical protein
MNFGSTVMTFEVEFGLFEKNLLRHLESQKRKERLNGCFKGKALQKVCIFCLEYYKAHPLMVSYLEFYQCS